MNSKVYFKNRIVHKLHLAKKIPEHLRGYWIVERNGKYVGLAMIK